MREDLDRGEVASDATGEVGCEAARRDRRSVRPEVTCPLCWSGESWVRLPASLFSRSNCIGRGLRHRQSRNSCPFSRRFQSCWSSSRVPPRNAGRGLFSFCGLVSRRRHAAPVSRAPTVSLPSQPLGKPPGPADLCRGRGFRLVVRRGFARRRWTSTRLLKEDDQVLEEPSELPNQDLDGIVGGKRLLGVGGDE